MRAGVPSFRFFFMLAGAALTAALSSSVAIGVALLLVALALLDRSAARRARTRALDVGVLAPPVLSQLERAVATIVVENRGERAQRLRLALDVAPELAD